jgi:hypothetical protein
MSIDIFNGDNNNKLDNIDNNASSDFQVDNNSESILIAEAFFQEKELKILIGIKDLEKFLIMNIFSAVLKHFIY